MGQSISSHFKAPKIGETRAGVIVIFRGLRPRCLLLVLLRLFCPNGSWLVGTLKGCSHGLCHIIRDSGSAINR
ncbi:uncharacterized protein BDV14DRAFT_165961 [Aspergillus stella-maris]|uniref:uncharacterized protein n=1 Tax=Aspergillus stella-maris TaxID=1810926 RepID=UPI003CCD54F1